jgi:pyridinium-3,5-biscarboxylic acid mononucleotide synthase
VDRVEVQELLAAVAAGTVPVDAAVQHLAGRPFSVDTGFAQIDTHRALRTGDPEVVYGAGKSPAQAVAAVTALRHAHPALPALVTRADAEMRAALAAAWPDEALVEEDGRCVAVGPLPEPSGKVVVVSAGTSDGPVAAEAAFVARVAGCAVERVYDVGVAGIHRLLAARPVLDTADCLVVVAGMDGALPSAVGGLVGVPLVAVPTSVGYGAAFGGVAALLTMLNSCAPGVVVSNIDNGFGAGIFAARVARRSGARKA